MSDRSNTRNDNDQARALSRLRRPTQDGEVIAYRDSGIVRSWKGDINAPFIKVPPFPQLMQDYGPPEVTLPTAHDNAEAAPGVSNSLFPVLQVTNYRTLVLEIKFVPGSATSFLNMIQVTGMGNDAANMTPDMLVDNAITYAAFGGSVQGPVQNTQTAQRTVAPMSLSTRTGGVVPIWGKLTFDVGPYDLWRLSVAEGGDADNPGVVSLRFAMSD
jgi:hypothetical protein